MKINEKNLISFATAEPYDKCGFLYKKGEVNKAWQKRFFVLKGNLLFYFVNRSDKEPIGMIILEGCTVEMAEAETGCDQYCFKIIFHGPHNRIYILGAESQQAMESWMKAITCAGYDYMKVMVAELQRQLKELEMGSMTTTTAKTEVTPIAPPRNVRPAPKPPSQQVKDQRVNEGAPLGSRENKDPNISPLGGRSTFQRIHEKIGVPIIKETEDYKKQQSHASSGVPTMMSSLSIASSSTVVTGDGAPLIVL